MRVWSAIEHCAILYCGIFSSSNRGRSADDTLERAMHITVHLESYTTSICATKLATRIIYNVCTLVHVIVIITQPCSYATSLIHPKAMESSAVFKQPTITKGLGWTDCMHNCTWRELLHFMVGSWVYRSACSG